MAARSVVSGDKVYVPQVKSPKRPVWLWPNLLSLDAPLIAVLWLQLFAVSGRIRISLDVTLALALVVWVIYVADRLLDELRAGPETILSPRHQFYRAHRPLLLSLLGGVLALTCWICFHLDSRIFEFGTVLMLVVASYFVIVHQARARWRLHFPKEAVVAVVFGVGTVFPVWVYGQGSTPMAIALVFFIAICWLNTALIEYAEWMSLHQMDSEMPHASTLAAGRHLLEMGAAVAIAALLRAQLTTTSAEHLVLLAISFSAIALAVLGFCWRKLSIDTVRVLADATLLTPGAVLLFLHR